MNQFNTLVSPGSVGVAPWLMPPGAVEPAQLKDIPVAELGLRRMRDAADIREIVQLRQEIDLSAAASADPEFMRSEKKETSWAWSTLSSCMTAS
jgi:hypothetical protein